MFNVVDKWGIVVRTYEDREDAELYVQTHTNYHIEEGE